MIFIYSRLKLLKNITRKLSGIPSKSGMQVALLHILSLGTY